MPRARIQRSPRPSAEQLMLPVRLACISQLVEDEQAMSSNGDKICCSIATGKVPGAKAFANIRLETGTSHVRDAMDTAYTWNITLLEASG